LLDEELEVEKGDTAATPMNDNDDNEVENFKASQHLEKASMEVEDDSTTSI
jgi:hypothetical protein